MYTTVLSQTGTSLPHQEHPWALDPGDNTVLSLVGHMTHVYARSSVPPRPPGGDDGDCDESARPQNETAISGLGQAFRHFI